MGQGKQDISASFSKTTFSKVNLPLHQARGLPNECYVSEDFYQHERQEIFYQSWFALGSAADVRNPGDVAPKQIAGHPFLLVRTQSGAIKVFHNVCRHRGHILVSDAGNMPLIRCPYHSWCYGLDGSLKKTPHIGGSGRDSHPDFSAEDKGLFEVQHGEWMGVVFINPSSLLGEGLDFENYIAPVKKFWHEFADAKLYSYGDNVSFDFTLDCNWKFTIENYCEAYHLPWVHPGLNSYSRLEDHYNIEAETYSGQGTIMYQPMLDEQGRRFSELKHLSKKWEAGGEYLAIYPNLLYGVHKDHCFSVVTLPLGAGRSYEQARLYYFDEDALSEVYQPLRRRMMENWHQVFKEDIGVTEGMQKGRQSQIFDGGAFSPVMDGASHCFHKWVANKMQQYLELRQK